MKCSILFSNPEFLTVCICSEDCSFCHLESGIFVVLPASTSFFRAPWTVMVVDIRVFLSCEPVVLLPSEDCLVRLSHSVLVRVLYLFLPPLHFSVNPCQHCSHIRKPSFPDISFPLGIWYFYLINLHVSLPVLNREACICL